MESKPGYFKELDGIRGIAALMVMYFHFWIAVQAKGNAMINFLVKTCVFGQTGVTLFFVLSGFLITRILLSTKSSNNYFSTFYLRRALRIFPLYYLSLAIYLFISPLLEGKAAGSFSDTWSFWVYFQNVLMTFKLPIEGPLHFWSLAVEEHFYLFWPVLVYFLSPKQLLYTSFFCIGLAMIVRLVLLQQGYEVFYFTFTTMDALAIGAILAIKEKKVLPAFRLSSRHYLGLVLLSIPCICLWIFSSGKALFFVQAIKGTLIAAVYCLLLLIVIGSAGRKKTISFLLLKPLLYTGKISYGLYVYHALCFFIFQKYLNTSYLVLNLFGCLSLAYLLASVSYFLYERRFILLKDKINLRKTVAVK